MGLHNSVHLFAKVLGIRDDEDDEDDDNLRMYQVIAKLWETRKIILCIFYYLVEFVSFFFFRSVVSVKCALQRNNRDNTSVVIM